MRSWTKSKRVPRMRLRVHRSERAESKAEALKPLTFSRR